MCRNRKQAAVMSAVVGLLVAANCYLFFEDGLVAPRTFSDEPEVPSRGESEEKNTAAPNNSDENEG